MKIRPLIFNGSKNAGGRFLLVFWVVSLLVFSAQVATAERAAIAPGLLFLDHGDYRQAYDFFFDLLLDNPEDLEVNFYLGKAAYAQGDYEAAVMAFERVLILEPEAAPVKVELAKSFHRLGSEETARQYFEEALEADLPEEVRKNISDFLAKSKKK